MVNLVSEIAWLLPSPAKRYVEPFLGSGAVFLNTAYPKNLLSDSNGDLINLFKVLAEGGPGFVEKCRELFTRQNNTAEKFYPFRNEFNSCANIERKSALFAYLNRHCFNGLFRYNGSGGFNVPFGRYENPYFPHEEMLSMAEKLQGVELRTTDFRPVLEEAGEGDAVYCDPPYVPLSSTSNFTDYASGGFGPSDQADLAELALEAAQRGSTVVIFQPRHSFHQDSLPARDPDSSVAGFAHDKLQRRESAKGKRVVGGFPARIGR